MIYLEPSMPELGDGKNFCYKSLELVLQVFVGAFGVLLHLLETNYYITIDFSYRLHILMVIFS